MKIFLLLVTSIIFIANECYLHKVTRSKLFEDINILLTSTMLIVINNLRQVEGKIYISEVGSYILIGEILLLLAGIVILMKNNK